MIIERPAWHKDALCREYPMLSWFPEPGGGSNAIKAICGRCSVRAECAEAGKDEPYGWWGGVSERHRRRAVRETKWSIDADPEVSPGAVA
jgi:WhiB family redox-sensing transcriptional regulator